MDSPRYRGVNRSLGQLLLSAVLVPLHGWPDEPGLIFTERRADMRRHAGEISFPGGRKDDADADLAATALREAQEEIGLDPAGVELCGALPPAATFVTGYRIHPFVGLIADPAELDLVPNPDEVETSWPSRSRRYETATKCAAWSDAAFPFTPPPTRSTAT